MADHSKPTLTSNYTAFVDEIKGRLEDVSKGFDPAKTSPTNIPVDTIRWASSSNKWQRWNGSAWVDLASTYAVNVATASRLQTGRTIALSGGATGSASFDGSANITISVDALNPSQLASPVPINKGGTGASTAEQARDNLGLGNAATQDFGTGANGVARGNHTHAQYWDIVNATGYAPSKPMDDFVAGDGGYIRSGENPGAPATGLDVVTKQQYGSSDLMQIAFPQRGVERLLMRTRSSSGWGDWFEFYHTKNPPPAVELTWANIAGKPSVYPSSWANVSSKPATATRWPTWGEVTGKPSGFTPPTGHGGVGTYAFVSTSGASSSWGGTIAGSHLRPANMTQASNSNFQVSSTSLAGTWRVMGYILGGSTATRGITLAVRIS